MKIKGYYLPAADDGLAGAVADAAALFSLPAAGILSVRDVAAGLPVNTVLIYNSVSDRSGTAVITQVYFWREAGVLGCYTRRETSGEEAAVAIPRLVRLNLLTLLRRLTGEDPGPWGIMRGVRPIKLVHRLLDNGWQPEAAVHSLTVNYAVADTKARLLTDIALRQRPFLPPKGISSRVVGIYVGVPYCPSRCLYCSFPSQVLPGDDTKVAAFFAALAADIAAAGELLTRHGLTAESVYVGGGTPTSLDEEYFARLLALVRQAFVTGATREFTVEAGRPDTISAGKIAVMAAAGATRVSVNPQTMQEKTLKHIGRNHNVHDIIDVFRKIRSTGFAVINMDIIAGLPGEDAADMANTLEQIARLGPDNLTVHTLAIKKGSTLAAVRDEVALPDEATTTAMLALANDVAGRMGLEPYYLYRQKYMTGNLENIGYARPGTECIYNIQIIGERQTIIGVGPAAATKAVTADFRLTSCYNPKDVNTYINNIDSYVRRRDRLIAGLFSVKEETG